MSLARLSRLQKAILRSCYPSRGRVGRERLTGPWRALPTTAVDTVDAITKALERLIDRGFLVGYGVRTPTKWFIHEVRLTPAGRRVARRLAGEQQPLPLHS